MMFWYIVGILASFMVLAETAEDEEWSYIVMADWHFAEQYARKPGRQAKLYDPSLKSLKTMRDISGSELVIMPGDTNEGRWNTPTWINKNMPGLAPEDAVYQAGRNCYGTIKQLFQEAGFEKLFVSIGDHELGDNYWGPEDTSSKTQSLPKFRQSLVDALYRDPVTDEFIFKDDHVGSADPTPYGTIFEYTSFAHVHKNALFITVDVFAEVSDPSKDFIDRTNGLGGEGIVTGDVNGLHLEWFENVLKEASKDDSIEHIFVQSHLPILQPTRKMNSSSMFFDRGENSEYWKLMVEYGVDIYFAGEVHANTVSKTEDSSLLQVVSKSHRMHNFLVVNVSEDSIQINAFNEIGTEIDIGSDRQYEVIGSVTIDKSSGKSEIASNGDLEILNTNKPLLHFTFEDLHEVNERQMQGLYTKTSLLPDSVTMRGVEVHNMIYNQGSFGPEYDALVGDVSIVNDGFKGNAGNFDGVDSKMGVYGIGPNLGGSVISYSTWFQTQGDGEMILIHFGESWWTANEDEKNNFSLTLNDGVPKLYASPTSFLEPANKTAIDLNDLGWHQVAVSMSHHSCPLSQVKLYIDGQQVSTRVENDMELFFFNHGRIGIGSFGFTGTLQSDFVSWKPFLGKMDEVYVWSKPIWKYDLKRSPQMKLKVKKNKICTRKQLDGMKFEIYPNLKRKRCRQKCMKDLSCMGSEFVRFEGGTECFMFKNRKPELGVKNTTENYDHLKCFVKK